jgi:hypothetical protein
VWANDAASGVRLDGYGAERIVKSLFNGHLNARFIFIVSCIVRGTRALFLGIGIRAGVEVAAAVVIIIIIDQPFAL